MTHSHVGFPWQKIRIENELLIRCLATQINVDTRHRLHDLLAQGVDWTYLIQTALDHQVTPQLYEAFERLCSDDIPAEILDALRVHCEDNAARNRLLARELVAIKRDLAQADIHLITFKGPTLAQTVYGNGALRSAGDLDFLIQARDVDKACEILFLRGYRRVESAAPEGRLAPHLETALRRLSAQYQFVRDSDHVMIEPHWALVPSTLAVDIDYDGLWRRAPPVSLDGDTVATLAEEDLMLILCIHGSKHQWVQLRWVHDIARLIAARPQLDWDACLLRARDQGAERMLLLGLALARDICSAALPPVVQARLDADPVAEELAQLTCTRMFREGNATPDPSRITAYRYRMRERWRDRLAYVARTLCAPREIHLAMVRFPAPLMFLYVPLKLVHDYLLLPAWRALRPILPARRAEGGGDTARAKDAVRAQWITNAPKWDRWADDSRDTHRRINELLIEAAGITPGQRVLDLASGVGEPALSIAKRLDGDGFVIATDLVPTMLSTTRRRAASGGGKGLGYCATDMEVLPFADAVFDRVVCRLGIMFCPQPDHALAEGHRVLKPGGLAAFLVWGRLDENTIFKTLYSAVTGMDNDSSNGEAMMPFRFAASDDLLKAMRRAGFTRVTLHDERFDVAAAPGSRFWQPALEMTFGDHLATLTTEARALMERNIEAAFDDCRGKEGYCIATHVRIAVGTRDEARIRCN